MILIVVFTALLFWLINKWFRRTEKSIYPGNPVAKFVTGIVFTLLLGLGVFGRLNQYPLRWSDAFIFDDNFKANLSLNPAQSFLSTLKFKNSTYDLHKVKAPTLLIVGSLDHDVLLLNKKAYAQLVCEKKLEVVSRCPFQVKVKGGSSYLVC